MFYSHSHMELFSTCHSTDPTTWNTNAIPGHVRARGKRKQYYTKTNHSVPDPHCCLPLFPFFFFFFHLPTTNMNFQGQSPLCKATEACQGFKMLKADRIYGYCFRLASSVFCFLPHLLQSINFATQDYPAEITRRAQSSSSGAKEPASLHHAQWGMDTTMRRGTRTTRNDTHMVSAIRKAYIWKTPLLYMVC